ncbi:MAG: hypothetical protein V3S28_08035 [Acidimicrobiia bacterium]
MLAFATAAAVFVTLIVTASVAVSFMNADALRPVRTTGPTVKRWSGYVLIAVGFWFILLAAVSGPVLLP